MKIFKFFPLILLLVVTATALHAQEATIRGKMIDEESGEPLMFANVYVPEKEIGSNTDLDGAYELNLPLGTYTVEFSYTGYANKTVTDVNLVKEKQVYILDVTMAEESTQLVEVVVKAEAIERSDVALLALQKKSISIGDGISAQSISKYGSSSAADAITRTPGASVVDGKYVIVRGLGDRYSNALLNGLQLPSTDPYRNSTQLDLIPANLLDNIISTKTFIPDQPGNFTGGSVNIKSKSFPEAFTLSASASFGFNTISSLNDNFLSHDGGDTDWLGYDDGGRDIDPINADPATWEALRPSAHIGLSADDEEDVLLANIIENSTQGFSEQMAPTRTTSSVNQSYAFSIGNQYKLGENKLGVLFGLNYRRKFTYYESAAFNYYEVGGAGAEQLGIWYELEDTKGTESPTVSGLLGLSYKIGDKNTISFNTLYNHDADKTSRILEGSNPAQLSNPDGRFQSNVIEFRERELRSYQLLGEHKLGDSQKAAKLEWGGSVVSVSQYEPNLRQYANEEFPDEDGNPKFRFNKAEFDLPFVYWRDLKDDQYLGKVDLTIPISQNEDLSNMIKFGGMYSTKDRTFDEIYYTLNDRSSTAIDFDGDPDNFFAHENTGIIGINENNNRYEVNNYWLDEEIAFTQNSYTGNTSVAAAYGMLVYDWNKFRFVAGARGEWTSIEVESRDTNLAVGTIDTFDLLPSISLSYNLDEEGDLKLRASYTETLARPNMRELAAFSAVDFLGGFRLSGNPNLERTNIKNYDLRFEWYPRKGEILAVSGFYKDFTNPIVQAFRVAAANPEIQFQNIENASVTGIEFEIRKRLDIITPALQNFLLSTNISFIKSETDIPEEEIQSVEDFNPNKGTTRPFYGQSNYIFNAGLNYVDADLGLDVMLAYNVFGRRLVLNSEGEVPDIYEEPRPQLDLTIRKRLNDEFALRLSAMNILDSPYKQTMNFEPTNGSGVQEYIIQEYRRGVMFNIGISYNIVPQ